jgi:hypothetical protein
MEIKVWNVNPWSKHSYKCGRTKESNLSTPKWTPILGVAEFEMSLIFGSKFGGENLVQIRPLLNHWKYLQE